MRIRVILMTVVVVLFLSTMYVMQPRDAEQTFSSATLRMGSTGQDVTELQGRLNFLGYYDGKIDGIFGSKTKNAVTWFQWKFGLKSDGVVGSLTKQKLVDATKAWKPGQNTGNNQGTTGGGGSAGGSSLPQSNRLGLTENDLKIMANAVYGEARGEPYQGQVAVAAVILNRVKSQSFPNSVYGVIFQPGAFTAVADGQIYLTPNDTARKAVEDAINGIDPTNGCLYYFNPVTATSKWIWTRQQIMTIGKHIFCI
ncbi:MULTISPECIES: spore cortex-lytic enzyme [unclassified Paenibacillus]|uniref:spore cortex-lytic enzyme n=1 Tax=unclassified Paenibacillus TaxID=185978 RepID=UPI002F42119B